MLSRTFLYQVDCTAGNANVMEMICRIEGKPHSFMVNHNRVVLLMFLPINDNKLFFAHFGYICHPPAVGA